jgi:hypothetical protein
MAESKNIANEENPSFWNKVGDFFEKIGYDIAKFASEHPFITGATVVLLSTAAGYFTGGPFAAAGGAIAGLKNSKDVIEACENFATKYEEKMREKEALQDEKIAKEHEPELGKAITKEQTEAKATKPEFHNNHAANEAKRHPEISHENSKLSAKQLDLQRQGDLFANQGEGR